MKNKKTKIIASTVALTSIAAVGVGAAIGIINLNKNQTTTNNKNLHKSLSQIINNTAPSLYLKNPSFVAKQQQNTSFNPVTQNTVYLDPNLNILDLTGVSSIEYT
ncbi:hypothetical protein IKS57_02735 [bacterium]|nr:hypothetical protein [bacterium]